MKKLILSILIIGFSLSSIEFSGDARFRPRYDVKTYSDTDDNNSDFYYLYVFFLKPHN